jgi:predicted acylesterase/phospholipase RssA
MLESPKSATPGAMKPEQVRFLVFEGGGGKGFAYLGALQALEDPAIGILKYSEHPDTKLPVLTPGDRIEGIGGASAGAITALLLSCGYSSSDIKKFMELTNFDLFFDRASPRTVPGPFDGRMENPGRVRALRCERKPETGADRVLQVIQAIGGSGPALITQWLKGVLKPPVSTLIKEYPQYLMYLGEDMGLFSGCFARAVFADALASRLPKGPSGEAQYNATFRDHWKHCRIRLGVTGTNLESGKSQLFSVDETPDFPVADAIRISMSLPGIYKPYAIRKGSYKGVWVDGGLLNNVPFYQFESRAGENPKTLGLRIGT